MSYALQDLFNDQDPNLVHDTVASLLAWVPGESKARRAQPFRFALDHSTGGAISTLQVDLTWDLNVLKQRVPGLEQHVKRLSTGQSVQREHVTELAAYGLAFVAICLLMPGRRVKTVRLGLPPDLLFDVTPTSLRGVEVAGRKTGGRSAFARIRNGVGAKPGKPVKQGKRQQIIARTEIAEAHISLWCASPRISIMEQVKP